MSSTTTIIATPQHNGFRLSPGLSNRSQLGQISYTYQQERLVRAAKSGLVSHHNMSSAATYYGQRAVPYETGAPSRDSYNLAQVERWATARDTQNWQDNCQAYPAQSQGQQRQQYQPPQIPSQARHVSNNNTSHTISRQPTRPSTPNSARSSQTAATTGDSQSMVLHSMQIPACISPKGGNLADFAAQLTCLFWFETPKVLETAEKIRSIPENKLLPLLSANAFPTESFRKWVTSVLTTTQVTQNVIFLALMFIYRLKMTNPSVRGRPGSEYRLLTVALMLGNKFLDDNTYTNKTWAEVSGISVQEIHVMEVEFLSNMKYALLASKEQWEEWLEKLSSYYIFWDRATTPVSPSARVVPSPTLLIPSPTMGKDYSPLSSPTGYQSQQPISRTNGNQIYLSPNHPGNPVLFPTVTGTMGTVSPPRPDLSMNARKRSWDEQSVEPPAKRAYRAPQQAPSSVPKTAPDARRLPVPSLTLNTAQQAPVTQPPYVATNYSIPQATPYGVSLPPLEPGIRAMSTVYAPPTTASWIAPPTVTSGGPAQPLQSIVPPPTSLVTPTSQYPPTSNATYGTPTKRLSPINTLTPGAAYNASSPLHEYPQNGFHTPISHSPSIYLQHRASPYRPIRQVRTLLNPPPPASLQGYQLPAIPPSQMHYQPIGRRNDQRTGIVPEYRNQEMYSSISRLGPNHHQQQHHQQQQQHRYPNLMN